MLEFLVFIAGKVLQQTVGIPMGKIVPLISTKPNPYNLFSQLERNTQHLDSISPTGGFEIYLGQMYFVELEFIGLS